MRTTNQNRLILQHKVRSRKLSTDQKRGILAFVLIIVLFFLQIGIILSQS